MGDKRAKKFLRESDRGVLCVTVYLFVGSRYFPRVEGGGKPTETDMKPTETDMETTGDERCAQASRACSERA